jgi:uncharacterized protein YqeY
MKENLKNALKEAMKAKDSVKLAVIRGILSEIQYDEMNKGVSEATAADVTAVLQREIKKRKEEVEFAQKANRNELIEKLDLEIKIIEGYLPEQMSAEALKNFFAELKQKDGSANRGTAMKALKDAFSGQYDGKIAATVAQEVFG